MKLVKSPVEARSGCRFGGRSSDLAASTTVGGIGEALPRRCHECEDTVLPPAPILEGVKAATDVRLRAVVV